MSSTFTLTSDNIQQKCNELNGTYDAQNQICRLANGTSLRISNIVYVVHQQSNRPTGLPNPSAVYCGTIGSYDNNTSTCQVSDQALCQALNGTYVNGTCKLDSWALYYATHQNSSTNDNQKQCVRFPIHMCVNNGDGTSANVHMDNSANYSKSTTSQGGRNLGTYSSMMNSTAFNNLIDTLCKPEVQAKYKNGQVNIDEASANSCNQNQAVIQDSSGQTWYLDYRSLSDPNTTQSLTDLRSL